MQQELETALLELKTAKQMIELLQEESNCAALSTIANTQVRNSSYGLNALNSNLEKNIQATGENSPIPDENTTNSLLHNNHNQYRQS